MPLTALQARVFAAIANGRDASSYLAGGAALHLAPTGLRYSNDLDLFHTTQQAANETFAIDAATLQSLGFTVTVTQQFAGLVSATVSDGRETTAIDWAHESAWRFLPLVPLPDGGVMLHPIDLAVNKLVALAHRREPRDVIDVLFADEHVLPFPALVWAVVDKNPGLNPARYLDQFRRRTITPEDAALLRFSGTYDVTMATLRFQAMIEATDAFIAAHMDREPGALFQDRRTGGFFVPQTADDWAATREHRGALGGVVPLPADLGLTPT